MNGRQKNLSKLDIHKSQLWKHIQILTRFEASGISLTESIDILNNAKICILNNTSISKAMQQRKHINWFTK